VLLSGVDRPRGNVVLIPESTDQRVLSDLGERFRDFVRKLLGPRNPDIQDLHFLPQFQLLRPDVFPYTDVVKVKELDAFVERFVASSSERRQFNLLSMNRSMRIDPQTVFDAETGALVDSFFAADFEQFGYQQLQFAEVAEPLPLSTREMELISIVKGQSNRVDEMKQLMRRDSRLRSRVIRRARAIRRRVRTRR
jgi:hypothetical protein